jgi:polyhydroxyalkanoate synthesis repressor PhaR
MQLMTTTPKPEAKATVLKKYPNRRLYDPSKNSHVTLSEVADRVKNGEQIRIIDHKTGEDLTHVTMGQVLFETLKTRPDYLPLDLVLLMIRAQDTLVRGFLYNGLPQAFQMYMENQRRMMSGMNWLSNGYPGFSNFPPSFPAFFNNGTPGSAYQQPPNAAPQNAGPAAEPAAGENVKDELDRLRKEIDALKAEIPHPESKKAGRKKPAT